MKRINDNYNWKTMEHWKYVMDKNCVEWKEIIGEKVHEKEVNQAVQLLLQDCFPIAIICCIENGKKKIIGTPIWKEIFRFLNNERKIERNGKIILFKNLNEDEKRKLLDAQIHSIWIDMNSPS